MIQKHAPEEMVRAVKVVLEREDGNQKDIFVLRHFETHWTDGLAAMLMDKIKSGTLSSFRQAHPVRIEANLSRRSAGLRSPTRSGLFQTSIYRLPNSGNYHRRQAGATDK